MALKEIPADNLFGETPKTTLDIIKLANKKAQEQKAERVRHSVIAERAAAIVGATTADNEYNEVVAKYKNTDQWMKAPNGEPTNLTERQWVQVRTPSFKAWFGDWENDPATASKVVDQNGEPMVVYHGTEASFNEFKHLGDTEGFYFTPWIKFAEQYGNVDAFFLNIRNPIQYDEEFTTLNDVDESAADGFIYLGEDMESGVDQNQIGETEIVAFNANQIKSATNNNGEFSRNSNDVRYSIQSSYNPDTLVKIIDGLIYKPNKILQQRN